MTRRLTARYVAMLVTTCAILASPYTAAAEPTAPDQGDSQSSSSSADNTACPALQLVVIPGTTEIDEQAPSTADSGFFSRLTVPALQEAATRLGAGVLDRAYVAYPASFGGKPGDRSSVPYADSVRTGVENTSRLIGDLARRCVDTQFFVAGYSQGAHVAAEVLRTIGASAGILAADRLAGAALFSDPTREQGSTILGSGALRPAPAPGTDGRAVAEIELAPSAAATAAGGGIAPEAAPSNTPPAGFGAIADRVASYCTSGDMACDTPADAPAARLVASIAGQSSLDTRDPVRILTDIGGALGRSGLMTAASIVNDNLDFNSGSGQFEVSPAQDTILDKMVRFSDPGISSDQVVSEGISALAKIAGMGIGAAITVARDVLTPQTIGQLATVGLANPPAALALLAARTAEAAVRLVPPATLDATVQLAFDEITRTVSDNAGISRLVTDTSYWQSVAANHGSYGSTAVGRSGETPVDLTKRWVLALAADLVGAEDFSGTKVQSITDGAQLLGTPETVLSATDILTGSTVPPSTQTTSSVPPTTTIPASSSPTVTPSSTSPAGSSTPASTTAAAPMSTGSTSTPGHP